MFKGSFVALITPMHEDGGVDEAAFAAFVEWQVQQGTEGIVPVGTTGESPTLSHDEHRRVVEIAVEVAADVTGPRRTLDATPMMPRLRLKLDDILMQVHGKTL